MKLVEYKLEDFIEELGSKSPAPGGGSVAALSGSNAAALVTMVSELTTKKKKFKELPDEKRQEYLEYTEFFNHAKKTFLCLIDDDTCAFNEVMEAFKLPKETEDEVNSRNKAIELATLGCIKVPMEVATLALQCLYKMEYIIKNSNRNTTSDQGVAVLSLYTAFIGAVLNVKINLPGLSEKTLVNEYKNVIIDMTEKAEGLKDKLLEEVNYLLD
jgi:formiminotetrahydrofolate cyclodeaminase